MADSLPVTIQMGALPVSVRWTPQQLADAMVARMRLVTAQTFALFVTGSTEPSSNVGPWARNGSSWYYFNPNTGDYQPMEVPAGSLRYTIGPNAPDHLVYLFWIETDLAGSPLALKIYYSGAWVDVYASQFANYLTIASAAMIYAPLASPPLTGTPTAPTAGGGTNTTQIATTAFVQAAVAAIPGGLNPIPGVGRGDSGQSILADGTETLMTLNSAPLNGDGRINVGGSSYVANADGDYHFDVISQFDNAGAAAAGMEITIGLYVNGVNSNKGDADGTPSPNGGRWTPGFGALIHLTSGDIVTCKCTVNDGVGAGHVTVTAWELSGFRVK